MVLNGLHASFEVKKSENLLCPGYDIILRFC